MEGYYMRRKNTFYKATALAMTSVLTLGAPVLHMPKTQKELIFPMKDTGN